MSDKSDNTVSHHTPVKARNKVISYPSSSSAKIQMEFVTSPKKSSRTDVICGNLEEEEFPHGFTLLNSLSSPSTCNSNGIKTPTYELRTESSTRHKQLSLLAHFDELMRSVEEELANDVTEEFLEFAEHQELCRLEWLKSVNECRRLQEELDKANHEIGDFQNKLKNARRLLDQERKLRKRAEDGLICLEKQVYNARALLSCEKDKKSLETSEEKFSFLNSTVRPSVLDKNISLTNRLDTIDEITVNTTGSLLSNFSCSRSDEEIDSSIVFKMKTQEWKPPKRATKSPKKNLTHKVVEINSSDKIVATTTLAMTKDGPITATSVIEALPQSESETASQSSETPSEIPPEAPQIVEKTSSTAVSTSRSHNFVPKPIFRTNNTCGGCQSRIFFGKVVSKCKDCKNICHNECRNLLPRPCVPVLNTPTPKATLGPLSDYAPNSPPMVPSLIIHCVNEIELRGFKEIGLYRVPGVEKDIKALKEKLLRIKTIPNLSNIDVHVLCGVVKDFLRSLKEPLLTYSLRKDFIEASGASDEMDVNSCFYQTISQLPRPNRDTLAYIMLHLNRVAASRDCRMPSSNLSKIFGPTIIGYSSHDVERNNLLLETKQQLLVMDHLMKIPIDYWSSFINISESAASTPRSYLLRTPSTASVKNTVRRKFFTPEEPSSTSARKRTKYFTTPPKFKL